MKKNMLQTTCFRNLRQAIALLVLILAGALSACELIPDSNSGDGPKGCGFGEGTNCNTYVTAENIACGGGEFGAIWLKLDDGTYLQPLENTTSVKTIEAGKRYRIGVDYLNAAYPHPNQVVCLAVVPPSKPVRIKCIVAAEPVSCDTYVTATSVNCSVGAWNNIWLKLDNGFYLQPWVNVSGVQQIEEGRRYKVAYEPMQKDNRYDNQFVCEALPLDSLAWNPKVVAITCLQESTEE